MMKSIMRAFALLTILLGFMVAQSPSCTLAGKSFSQFDDKEYVFTGLVVGYTESIEFDEDKSSSTAEPISSTLVAKNEHPDSRVTGLIVKVKETVYLPKPLAEIEVFQYDLLADCSLLGVSSSALKKKFPINSDIRVVAKEAKLITGPSTNRLRLEDRPGEQGQVVINTDSFGKPLATTEALFDYKRYRFDADKDSDSKYLLPAFEVRKDLLRLKRAATQTERNSTLDRLYYAPRQADLDFKQLFDLYAASPAEARRYYESQFKMTDAEGFEMYQLYQKVLDELVKRGHSQKVAETALGRALEVGAKLNEKGLLTKSLEFLVPDKRIP